MILILMPRDIIYPLLEYFFTIALSLLNWWQETRPFIIMAC